MSVSGSSQQDPAGALVQDRCMRISCARSLSADLLYKISLSLCLHQDPVGPLVRDLCVWISCARSLCHDLCIRILHDHLCKTTCARSLYVDLLCKISLSGSLHEDPVELLLSKISLSCFFLICRRARRQRSQSPI